MNPLHVWVFHKYDIMRGRKFCRRGSFSIVNTIGLKELEKWNPDIAKQWKKEEIHKEEYSKCLKIIGISN